MEKAYKIIKALVLVYAVFCSVAAFATDLPPQNVIFITMDGVRDIDIYKPEKEDYDFLEAKRGYPLALFQNWAKSEQGHFFGTQKNGDRMYAGSTTCMSLPGYKSIFSGKIEKECMDNRCSFTKQNTMINDIEKFVGDSKSVALFSSWNNIKFATEKDGATWATQSIGAGDLQNFKIETEEDRKNFNTFSNIIKKAKGDLPKEWDNARKDEYTWELAVEYIKAYRPRFTYISLLDTDEWAHLANPLKTDDYKKNKRKYFESLNDYDTKLIRLVSLLNSEKYKNFLENTSIIITTDHGRGKYWWSFFDHGKKPILGMLDGSQNVWSFVIPSRAIRKEFQITRSDFESDKPYFSHLNLRNTIETFLNGKQSPTNPLVSLHRRKEDDLMNSLAMNTTRPDVQPNVVEFEAITDVQQ